MKSIIYKFLLIIFITITISLNGCENPNNSTKYGNATLKGKVINAADNTGIAGAVIRCNVAYDTSDSFGNYIVEDIYMGNTIVPHDVYVTHDSFYPDSAIVILREWSTTVADFSLRPIP